jgi:hypothetical protein
MYIVIFAILLLPTPVAGFKPSILGIKSRVLPLSCLSWPERCFTQAGTGPDIRVSWKSLLGTNTLAYNGNGSRNLKNVHNQGSLTDGKGLERSTSLLRRDVLTKKRNIVSL